MNAPISAAARRPDARPLPKPGTKRWKNFAKWAKAEFASASAEELARLKPPSNDEWDQMKNTYLVPLRIAYRMVQIDKAAHVAAINAMTKEESANLFACLEECVDRFRCFADLADDAIERLLCAAAKIELEAEERT
jgi:hypothetical protein